MKIKFRIRRLPQELVDDIFKHTLLADLPHGRKVDRQQSPTNLTVAEVNYTRPVPRQKTTLSCLVSYMNEILFLSKDHGLDHAQATLCIVRLFTIFDLFRHIPTGFFQSHVAASDTHNGILGASGYLRLCMLMLICQETRGETCDPVSVFPARVTYGDCELFRNDIEYSSELCFESVPDFLLRTVDPLLYHPDDDILPPCGYSEDDFYFKVDDGRVRALFIWEIFPVPYTWLSRQGGPWLVTRTAATIKYYDEHGRGGVIEWNLKNEHYELEFSNVRSINCNIDWYLCTLDQDGIRKTNQARNDADYARQSAKERRRGKTVAAMSKTERAKRDAREGRFWCLA